MSLPLIRDPETGDPIGFVIDAEGRYVDRGEFEIETGIGINPRSKGLEAGDRVYMHGKLVHAEGGHVSRLIIDEDLRRMVLYGIKGTAAAGQNSNHEPRRMWSEWGEVGVKAKWPHPGDNPA